ncbi:glycosyltransferase involved in cell wall biosynthesis [Dysgonomonas hofstadii]|uniref:Glycosyltransferase involved in cell wall biosynthesis n=2 Tax=Dysgonomonas hofstadii TaxID=637886 RepID=A0A840CSX1_9BACT|nr:glycosyltransferase involved in cell wall biosynthesis [Dysgonomonas hofstadii]
MIAVSNATAKKAVSLGIKPGKIVVISNGVDITPSHDISTEAFQNWLSARQIDLAGRKLLIMMGRPVRRKGFTWFAEQVLPLLQDQFYLVIVGPFHQRATLSEKIIYSLPKGFRKKMMLLTGYFSDERQLRKVINNTTNIKHLGRLPYPEIEILLSKTDAFLMPNIPVDGDMEGFGLVCLEASAHGSLVFAANIDGISDAIMDGKNGYLLPSEDSHAWVDKLIELSLNPDSFQQYRPVFSQYTIDNYSWTKMVCNYHMVFMNLSDSHK